MILESGVRLGSYELQTLLGAGGMGEVWRAYDHRLQRTVAIKVLADRSEQASSRILAEARAASALNHPNVCVVHEVGVQVADPGSARAASPGTDPAAAAVAYIVMELVEGTRLDELVPDDGLPGASVIRYGSQIADALAHAHEHGILHRDLKSANIVVTADARVKVLDFGVAARLPEDDAAAVTRTVVGIGAEGSSAAVSPVVGTLAYIAPEVLRGQPASVASDVWALGVVLHEMALGRRPFEGATAAELLASVLKDEPQALPARVSAGLRAVVRRCLAKEPGSRYRSAAVVQGALDAVQADAGVAAAPGASHRLAVGRRAVIGAAALAGVAGIVYVASVVRPSVPSGAPRLVRPEQVTNAIGIEDHPSWSGDGRAIVYARTAGADLMLPADWRLWVAPLDGGPPVRRGGDDHDSRLPSWSPDGSQIAFWSEREGGGYFVMPALGGPARKIADEPSPAQSPVRWSSDGARLAYVVESGGTPQVEIVTRATGETRRVDLPGRASRRFDLSWSPDGRFFAYVNAHQYPWQDADLWVVDAEAGGAAPIAGDDTNDWSPSWSPDARTLYFVSNRGGEADLWRQPIGDDARPSGAAEAVTSGVGMRHAAFSPDGARLAYSRGRRIANVWRIPLRTDEPATWEEARQLTFDQAFVEFIDLSPDGRLLLSSDRRGNNDIWVLESAGSEPLPLTSDPAPEWGPVWSPDASQVVFYGLRDGSRRLLQMPVGGGAVTQLTSGDGSDWMPAWSPDATTLAFHSDRAGNLDVWTMAAGGGDLRQITRDPADDEHVVWSPDGRTLLFASVRSGATRLYAVPAEGGEPVMLGDSPIHYFRLGPEGRRVYYPGQGTAAGDVWVVPLAGGAARPVTDLAGRVGRLGSHALALGGDALYFTWEEDVSDIWVMDVEWDTER